MQRVPMPSQTPSPVAQGEADAAEREDQADQRAEVLQQDDRQLGGLGAADELRPGERAAQLVGLLDGRTEGEALGDDREDEDADRPVPVLDLVRVLDLLVALVDGEHAADREQDDGDEEGVDVALAAVAEGVLRGRLALGLLAAEQQQALVAGVGERVHALGEHRRRAAEQRTPRTSLPRSRGWRRVPPRSPWCRLTRSCVPLSLRRRPYPFVPLRAPPVRALPALCGAAILAARSGATRLR